MTQANARINKLNERVKIWREKLKNISSNYLEVNNAIKIATIVLDDLTYL